MHINEAALAAKLLARHAVTTRRRLTGEVGLSKYQVDRLITCSRLITSGNGALKQASTPDTVEHRAAWAAAVTRGVVSFPTAGQLWKLRKSPIDPIAHVTVAWSRRVKAVEGVRIHRTRHLPPSDWVLRADGIRVTSAARTVFDAAALLGPDDLESMIEDALYRKLFTMPVLERLVERVGHPCRDGTASILRTLGTRGVGLRPVASHLELQLERALRRRGFPALERQVAVELPDGSTIHPDLCLPADRFYIEVDHAKWHSADADADRDKWRDRQLRLQGQWVERVTDRAIEHRLAETVEDLWAAWQLARAANTA